jgi:XTP/dITP diphosphohydrolase
MADKPRLVIATGNLHKIDEMRLQLSAWFEVFGLPKDYSSPIENGDSFAANARIKSETAAQRLDALCLADDSGLCVDHLGGAPGIFSSRYCGVEGDDEANNDKLLKVLADVAPESRGARFVCALSLAGPGGEIAAFEGCFEGSSGFERRGPNGFGYDPIFMLPEGLSSAELQPSDKQRRSHRGVALEHLARSLAQGDLYARCHESRNEVGSA